MTASVSAPIGCPMNYDPKYMVEVCLKHPLWSTAEESVGLEIISLLSQLDLWCYKELTLQPNGKISDGKASQSFQNQSLILLDQLRKSDEILRHRKGVDLLSYLKQTGLDELYPRASICCATEDISMELQITEMDEYFGEMSSVHQMVTLAQQINSDVSLSSHKYLAHQLAVLYQLLATDGDVFTSTRKEIQTRFQRIKEHLQTASILEASDAQWLLQMTTSLVSQALSIDDHLHDVVQPVLECVGNL
ncbi:hypothetical protein CAPTEDRAFT_226708 [Capitella teleta]|uniref:Uncharacterized protein n=1 Tax=Capitella teleta TaxID=283909 RepID=R7TV61_CAPTE|nr:hypothetical protein CAPTEDRAFT_226708 [Capitella teleta]|eukprot:ELT97783.1 hypothetical protein CAPTEDRAFT_226708 [Capitella teleta]